MVLSKTPLLAIQIRDSGFAFGVAYGNLRQKISHCRRPFALKIFVETIVVVGFRPELPGQLTGVLLMGKSSQTATRSLLNMYLQRQS